MKSSLSLFSLTALLVLQFTGGAKANPTGGHVSSPVVQISNGTVHGKYLRGWNQDAFLKIPYAQPPVGDLRFRPPQYINRNLGAIQATNYGPHCVGYGPDQVGFDTSEDCLTINVVRPAGIRPGEKLPVAVWIHGGGFFMGGAASPRYNLTWMVDQSVKLNKRIIGVSMNYRLAGWGFLASREVAGSLNLNNGLKDQRLALHWIQENIAKFGGDPRKVTIFGESAGGASVGFQHIAFNGRDDKLFRGAIMQSGGSVQYQSSQFPTDKAVQDNYNRVVAAADTLQCLRGADRAVLDAVFPTAQFGVVIDGSFVPGFGSEAIKRGRYVRVPTIIGCTSDEGASFGQIGANNAQDIANFLGAISTLTPPSIQRILELYPESASIPPAENFTGQDDGTAQNGLQYHRAAAIIGDWFFIANQRLVAQELARQGVPVWSYRFRTRTNGAPVWRRAGHFQEVAFVFNNVNGEGYDGVFDDGNPMGGPHAADYKKLADFMSRNWVGFVHGLDPRVGAKNREVRWLSYAEGNGKSQIVFDIDVDGPTYMETDNYRQEGIAFMNERVLEGSR
ncbi:hypothetical protein DRE_02669 [Drechslerella stenobrocha 248]|uniref:Carboxylic ester hydrolase n=1 Tax=Drechslerella stenobrocha 248 TaxID=1043628 RepID=W7IFZ4_9PEZI|nr:hypothetical protein DRE_02669 [Drechslerella stenobrocha 248]